MLVQKFTIQKWTSHTQLCNEPILFASGLSKLSSPKKAGNIGDTLRFDTVQRKTNCTFLKKQNNQSETRCTNAQKGTLGWNKSKQLLTLRDWFSFSFLYLRMWIYQYPWQPTSTYQVRPLLCTFHNDYIDWQYFLEQGLSKLFNMRATLYICQGAEGRKITFTGI